MKVYTKYLFAYLLFLHIYRFQAQLPFSLQIVSVQQDELPAKGAYQQKHPNAQSAKSEIQTYLNSLHADGYLLAGVDSLQTDTFGIKAFISRDSRFSAAHIRLGNLQPGLASRLGIVDLRNRNRYFNQSSITRQFEKILRYYENNGYPFVTVQLDSVEILGNELNAALNVQKNKFFKIDSIKIIGTAGIKKTFLHRYLSIRENMPYNEESFASISRKIKQLPFLSEVKDQRVQLSDKSNKLLLFLDKKNASQFDGIIGLLPDAATKKTIVTGDVKLKVVNGVFKNGETFDLEWRRLKTQTQDFNGRVIYPYLFGTPIGVDYTLKIYRRDTSFIDITNNVGLQYYFSGLNYFKVFYKQRNTNLISTNGLEILTSLPDYADITTQSYGLALFLEKLDYRFNPRKGTLVNMSIQTGNRFIRKNPKLNQVVYNSLLLRSAQYQFDCNLAAYLPLVKNHVLKFGLQAASVFGNSTVYTNELLRIGGLKTLRGFDEESIYTSAFVIPTVEYRFLFAQNSNLLLFAEGAWYENNGNRRYISDTPVSLGAGINFETKAGILSLNYALGNQFNNGFDPRSGKIHFGLTALF